MGCGGVRHGSGFDRCAGGGDDGDVQQVPGRPDAWRLGRGPEHRHCCIERSPPCDCLHFAAQRRQIMGTVEWFGPFLAPSMKESLHFAGLRQHILAQCNSAVVGVDPGLQGSVTGGI